MKAAVEQKTKADLKKEAIEKDKKRADELIAAYESFVADKAKAVEDHIKNTTPIQDRFKKELEPYETIFKTKTDPIDTSMEEAKKELLEIGNRQRRTLFGVDGNWNFENGYYIHAKSETVVKTAEDFSLSKFIKKFGDYVKVEFKIKELKALFTDADARDKSKIMDYGFDLQSSESLEIKKKKEK